MRAVVTGATRGLGRRLSAHLAAGGHEVVAVGRDAGALDALVAEGGPGVTPYAADVTDPARLAEVASAVGAIDLVVANAGALTATGPFWECDLDDWWSGFSVNVLGVAATARAFLPGMVERGSGRLVLMSSGMGNRPGPWSSQYAASKAAVTRWGESVQRELDGTGVRCFVVSPGMVRTDMTDWPEPLMDRLPALRDLPDDAWTPPELLLGLVDAIAAGELDPLAGRFVHATDDRASLLAAVDGDERARTLRQAPAYPGDPHAT